MGMVAPYSLLLLFTNEDSSGAVVENGRVNFMMCCLNIMVLTV